MLFSHSYRMVAGVLLSMLAVAAVQARAGLVCDTTVSYVHDTVCTEGYFTLDSLTGDSVYIQGTCTVEPTPVYDVSCTDVPDSSEDSLSTGTAFSYDTVQVGIEEEMVCDSMMTADSLWVDSCTVVQTPVYEVVRTATDNATGVTVTVEGADGTEGGLTVTAQPAPQPQDDSQTGVCAFDITLSAGLEDSMDGATISLPYTDDQIQGLSTDDLAIFYYNDSTGSWEEVNGSTVDTDAQTVSAFVTHFSTYGILATESATAVQPAIQQRSALSALQAHGSMLHFTLTRSENVTLSVFRANGARVHHTASRALSAGSHEIDMRPALRLGAGVYVAELTVGHTAQRIVVSAAR